MGNGWTVEVDTGAGFASRRHRDLGFDLALNQMGTFHATVLPGTTEPSVGDEVKIWWDLDDENSQKRLWVWGIVTEKEKDDITGWVTVRGYDDAYPLFQSSVGNLRSWSATTPYGILTTSAGVVGTPATTSGITYNAQNSQVMAYASTAANAITAASPGNALTFRAHTGNLLLAVARLCEQATSGGGPDYGLEWFVDRDGADGWTGSPQLNVVTRRERAAVYTAEQFRIGASDPATGAKGLHVVPRETVRDTDYNRVRVIGEGSGTSRIESAWVGAGSREYVFADKNISDTTTATNLANRILNSLNQGTTPRIQAETIRHDLDTFVGDDVEIIPRGGGAGTTYRCFGIGYELSRRSFRLEIGRQRRFLSAYLRDLERSADALGLHTQVTDSTRIGSSSVNSLQPASSGVATIADGAQQQVTLTFTDRSFVVADDEGLEFFFQILCLDPGTVNGLQSTVDVELIAPGLPLFEARLETTPGGAGSAGRVVDSRVFRAQLLEEVVGLSGTISDATLRVTNRSGAPRDIIVQLSAHVEGVHVHN